MVSNGQKGEGRARGGRCSPIVHVLNGVYPAVAVSRMTNPRLEQFVTTLVQCTVDVAAPSRHRRKPKWWPSGVAFRDPVSLDGGDVRLVLRRLVADCSQFFRSYAFRAKWLPTIDRRDFWSDRTSPSASDGPKKTCHRKFDPSSARIIIGCPPVIKEDFMCYLKLAGNRPKNGGKIVVARHLEMRAPPNGGPHYVKLSSCPGIPLSSDVGRAMASKENHGVSEDIKLKRLERSEWYTNRPATKAVADENFSEPVSNCKGSGRLRYYKMPKRQCYQTRSTFHSRAFLERFCRPVCVQLDRLDLEKMKTHRENKNLIRQPVVLLESCIRKPVILVKKLNLPIKGKPFVLPKRTSPRIVKDNNSGS